MSKSEEQLAMHIRAFKLPEPDREYRFHPTRKWRFDFAWPDQKIAVEVEGVTHFGKNKNGTMRLGRHQTSEGLTNDCEKYGEAMLLGWTVYRCTQPIINSGKAIQIIQQLLQFASEKP